MRGALQWLPSAELAQKILDFSGFFCFFFGFSGFVWIFQGFYIEFQDCIQNSPRKIQKIGGYRRSPVTLDCLETPENPRKPEKSRKKQKNPENSRSRSCIPLRILYVFGRPAARSTCHRLLQLCRVASLSRRSREKTYKILTEFLEILDVQSRNSRVFVFLNTMNAEPRSRILQFLRFSRVFFFCFSRF